MKSSDQFIIVSALILLGICVMVLLQSQTTQNTQNIRSGVFICKLGPRISLCPKSWAPDFRSCGTRLTLTTDNHNADSCQTELQGSWLQRPRFISRAFPRLSKTRDLFSPALEKFTIFLGQLFQDNSRPFWGWLNKNTTFYSLQCSTISTRIFTSAWFWHPPWSSV